MVFSERVYLVLNEENKDGSFSVAVRCCLKEYILWSLFPKLVVNFAKLLEIICSMDTLFTNI